MRRGRGAALRLFALGSAVALALGPAGCGVGAEETARQVEPPEGTPSVIASPTPAPLETGPVAQRIFLVRDGMLVPVERRVAQPRTVDGLLDDLVAGPTVAEIDAGFSSALLGSDVIASADVKNGVAAVELVAPIGDTGRTDEILALGQIVCTLTTRADITWVQFTRDGQPIKVPRGDAKLTDELLTAADYANVVSN